MEAEELIAAIVADPEDQTAWMVYADWLLERNHPRGELIQLGPLAKAGNNEARWRIQKLEVDEDPLLSPRLAARGKQWRFTFDRGFIMHAEFLTHGELAADAETVSALCADPHAALIQSIQFGVVEYRGPVDEITGLRQLVHSRIDVGDLDRELGHLQWMESLDVRGIACTQLTHRNLRHLGTDSNTCLDARIDLPALETLGWRPITEDAGFGTALRGALPKLRSIAIHNGYPAVIAELADERIARQLEWFSIQTGDLAVLTLLVTHAGAFSGLREIHIDGLYEDLEQAEVDALRSALERAYPGATIYAPWEDLVPAVPQPRQTRPEPPAVDEQSRRSDGAIDAIARWMRRT